MSELRKAAQAVVDAKDNPLNSIEDIEQVVERLRAALAQPETAEPVAWMHPGGKVLSEFAMKSIRRDFASFPEVFRAFSIPLYAHPPRDEWRLASEPPEDGRRVLIWVATESGEETFRPAYCPVGGWTSVFDGETLVAWRDVTPPTEGA